MKKVIDTAIGVRAVAALALATIPTAGDELHWQWASHKDESAKEDGKRFVVTGATRRKRCC